MQNGLIDKKQNVDTKKLISELNNIKVDFKFNSHSKSSETFLNDVNVELEIRSMLISDNVSKVSTVKEVREKMVALQREMGKHKGVILDGRVS